jgi:hypothetical protein
LQALYLDFALLRSPNFSRGAQFGSILPATRAAGDLSFRANRAHGSNLAKVPAWWPVTGRRRGDTIAVARHRTTYTRPFYWLERLRPGNSIYIRWQRPRSRVPRVRAEDSLGEESAHRRRQGSRGAPSERLYAEGFRTTADRCLRVARDPRREIAPCVHDPFTPPAPRGARSVDAQGQDSRRTRPSATRTCM